MTYYTLCTSYNHFTKIDESHGDWEDFQAALKEEPGFELADDAVKAAENILKEDFDDLRYVVVDQYGYVYVFIEVHNGAYAVYRPYRGRTVTLLLSVGNIAGSAQVGCQVVGHLPGIEHYVCQFEADALIHSTTPTRQTITVFVGGQQLYFEPWN